MPNLNKNSDKYFFKKKLTLRTKSKKKLIYESFLMFFISSFLIYINYLIPEKKLIFANFLGNFNKLISPLLELISYIYEISLTIFIVLSLTLSLILIIGVLSRLKKLIGKNKKFSNF